MVISDIKKNSVVWDGKKEGFYEAFYIQVNEPLSGMAWWFRYSILIPQGGRGLPYAALWAVQFDQSGTLGPVAMKHVYPLDHFRFEKDRFILYIEDGFITNSHSTGSISHGDRKLKWDIQWVPSDECFLQYPEYFYRTSYPRTKVVSPHWATRGGGFIRWGGNEYFLEDALIHVGHVWGNSHSKSWAWSHSHGFEENNEAVFEALWAPIFGSCGVALCNLKLDGRIFRFKNVGFGWQANNFLKSDKWKFKYGGSDLRIDGVISVDPAQVAGVIYHDPDGSRRYCYNSKVSTIKMDVVDKRNDEKYTLNSSKTAAFELCLPQEVPNFKILV